MLLLMYQIAQLRHWKPKAVAKRDDTATHEVPNDLMQSAEARAGQNPREAAQLRGAAQAYLSVVR